MAGDHEIRTLLSTEHGQPGFVTTVAVSERDGRGPVVDDALAGQALADGRRGVVAVDGTEIGTFRFEGVENALGREVASVEDEVGLADGIEEVAVEAMAVRAVGIRENTEHDRDSRHRRKTVPHGRPAARRTHRKASA